MNTLHIIKNKKGNWIWHVKAPNGRVLYGAADGDGFKSTRALYRNLRASFGGTEEELRLWLYEKSTLYFKMTLRPVHNLRIAFRCPY